jgi:hypothetical protein
MPLSGSPAMVTAGHPAALLSGPARPAVGGRHRLPPHHERPLDRRITRPCLVTDSDADCRQPHRQVSRRSRGRTPGTHTNTTERQWFLCCKPCNVFSDSMLQIYSLVQTTSVSNKPTMRWTPSAQNGWHHCPDQSSCRAH